MRPPPKRRLVWFFAGFAVGGGVLALLPTALRDRPDDLDDPGDRALRVALCQYDSRTGEYEWNVRHALRFAEEAAENGADLIILPEYSFCTAHDALHGDAFFRFRRGEPRLTDALSDFADDHDCHLVVNVPTECKTDETDLRRYNRSFVFGPDGEVVTSYDKRCLAALDRCCDVEPGTGSAMVDLPFGRVGLLVCRDASYPEAFVDCRGADLALVQFAHIVGWNDFAVRPAWLTNDISDAHEDFPRIARNCSQAFGCPILMVNKAGMEPSGAYTGGSCVAASDGRLVTRAEHGSDILYVDIPLDDSGRLFGAVPEAVID